MLCPFSFMLHSLSLSVTMFQLLQNKFVFRPHTHTQSDLWHLCSYWVCEIPCVGEYLFFLLILWRRACECVWLRCSPECFQVSPSCRGLQQRCSLWCLLPLLLWDNIVGTTSHKLCYAFSLPWQYTNMTVASPRVIFSYELWPHL